jgi:hypothetical protein
LQLARQAQWNQSMKTTEEIMDAAATHGTVEGWQFYIENFMGVCYYARPDSPLSIFCTPDWEEDGILAIEVQSKDGDTLAAEVLPFTADDRTIDRFVALVTPWLRKFQPVAAGDE